MTYFDHGVDVALGSGELGGVLDADENDEIEVVPHVVLVADVVLEADGLVVELRPVQAADEARVLQNLFFLLLLAPQVGERVDDDAENQVQHDNDDHEEEQQVVDDARAVHRLLPVDRLELLAIVFIHCANSKKNVRCK